MKKIISILGLTLLLILGGCTNPEIRIIESPTLADSGNPAIIPNEDSKILVETITTDVSLRCGHRSTETVSIENQDDSAYIIQLSTDTNPNLNIEFPEKIIVPVTDNAINGDNVEAF